MAPVPKPPEQMATLTAEHSRERLPGYRLLADRPLRQGDCVTVPARLLD